VERIAEARLRTAPELGELERVRSVEEGNPMLGTRGVRLGMLHPEIYEMQVRPIFRATATVRERTGRPPHLEIMIPSMDACGDYGRGAWWERMSAGPRSRRVGDGPDAGYARQGWHQWLWPYRPRDLPLRR
jgi:PEP-utilising enzyme, PEP-binding domain